MGILYYVMRKYTKEQLEAAVASSLSYREVHKRLGLLGYQYQSLRNHIKRFGLDTSHMRGRDGIPLATILVENSTYTKTGHLKNRLFKEGLKTPCCECCGLTEWRGKPIQFHLHHKNGHYRDNRLENLEILCPLCHSQTDNYGIKNRGKGRPR